MNPKEELLFCALGGSGEIGMNVNLYGCRGKWLMVDCGITFADPAYPGIDVILPDLQFIEDRIDDLVGIVLTHGHEDHIGALPYLAEDLGVPLYATQFTAGLIRGKLDEEGIADGVSEAVVHGLEVIEVDERDAPQVTLRFRERSLESLGEQAAVRQPGERVVAGGVPQTRLAAAEAVGQLTHQRPGGQQHDHRQQPLCEPRGGRPVEQGERAGVGDADPRRVDRDVGHPEEADRVQPHPQVVEGVDAARLAGRDEGKADHDFFDEVDREADELAAHVREGCLTMPDPTPQSMFDNVYVESHPRIEEERREFAAYQSSFEGEEVPA